MDPAPLFAVKGIGRNMKEFRDSLFFVQKDYLSFQF